MALQTRVKINSVTHLSDARYCAGMGVEWIGFCLDSTHPSYISPSQFLELSGWITGVQLIGEFFKQNCEEIKTTLQNYAVQWIQTDRADELSSIRQLGYPTILRLFEAIELPPFQHNLPDLYLLLELNDHLSKEHITEWKKKYPDYKLLIGKGITKENSLSLATAVNGIALNGSHEVKTGYSDFETLASILETLEIED
jgi:phosphoribosylanthranilate isomerase